MSAGVIAAMPLPCIDCARRLMLACISRGTACSWPCAPALPLGPGSPLPPPCSRSATLTRLRCSGGTRERPLPLAPPDAGTAELGPALYPAVCLDSTLPS